MTEREKQVLEIIRKDPMISHNEIARILDISSNTVAVHISHLLKEGNILGKAYIVKDDDYFVGIGAANLDLYGKSEIPIREHYDHPSHIESSVGGVTRNILDNLSRLGVRTKLLSAVGDDYFGEIILHQSEKQGIDTSLVKKVKGSSSGIFMQVLDEKNDMHMALCDMSVIHNIDVSYLKDNDKVLQNAKAIAFDPSLPPSSVEYLLENYSHKALFLDPVSDLYAERIAPYVDRVFAVKPNTTELAAMTGMPTGNFKEVKKAAASLIERGVKRVYVSLGKDGCLYIDKDRCVRRKFAEEKKMVNASGAGDAFFAGIIYGYMEDIGIEETLDHALAAGILTIRSHQVISPDMSTIELENIIKENKK